MANIKLNFEDFETEKLSKNQQKMLVGGDPVPGGPVDPGKSGGSGTT